jgi:hypothetical protein
MSDSPYELQRLVTVGTFSTPWEAQIAQARLGSEGLHSLIANEHVIRMVALSNAVGGIQLKVREPDAEAAAAVLRRLAPLPEIYLITQDPAAPATATPATPAIPALSASAALPRASVPAPVAAAALLPANQGVVKNGEAEDRGTPCCPSCGGFDLRPEQSSRLVLGVLPVSRRGLRCAGCGSLWRREEIRGAEARPAPRQEAGETGGPGQGVPEMDAGAPSETETESGTESEDTALSTVARFHTPWEAHLARTFLESEGLRCCVLEERLPAVHLLSARPVAYNRLEVRQADAARAAEILARAWSYPSLVALPDPDCGGSDPGADADFDADGDGGHGTGADRGPGDPPAGR